MGSAFKHPQGNPHEECRVFPEPPEPVAPTQEPVKWGNVGAWGCLVWMIVYFVGGFLFLAFLLGAGLTDNPTLRSTADWWLLPSGILGFAATIVVKLWRRAKERRELQRQEDEAARLAKEEEANVLTAELLEIRQSSMQLAAQMPRFLSNADASLRSAEEKFHDNASTPFWEAVQSSALRLAQFCATSQELARSADRYYGVLRDRRHTFPPFPIHPAELPNPTSLVDTLQSVVRRGQMNPPFAMMWEQYKAHQMAVYGFLTLEQAINGLPEAVIDVTNLLKSAISASPNKVETQT